MTKRCICADIQCTPACEEFIYISGFQDITDKLTNISRCIADNWPWLMLYAMLNFDEVHYTKI